MTTIIHGKKEICQAAGGVSWETIEKWIDEGFPARLICRRWFSDRELIAAWLRRKILEKDPT